MPKSSKLNKGYRILIFDDMQAWVDCLASVLALPGYQVTPTNTCKVARSLLANQSFDLAIFDVRNEDLNLYDHSGLILAKEAKKLSPLMKIGIITGYPEAELKRLVLDVHKLDGYWLKTDFNVRSFRQEIYELLQSSGKR